MKNNNFKYLILFLLVLNSCASVTHKKSSKTIDEMFAEGWELYIYNKQLVLKKEGINGLEINEFFKNN